jgi:DNA-binding transcriptional ArsR family regulator
MPSWPIGRPGSAPGGDAIAHALMVICLIGYAARVATAFAALAEPTRRHILDLLRDRPRPVGELVQHLGLSQPGTSKHLRVLRQAGLVRVRQDAQRRFYELRPEPLREVDAWLDPYRQLWARSLDALERHLEATDPHHPHPLNPSQEA